MKRLALGVLWFAALVESRADLPPPITFEPVTTSKMIVPADEVLQTLSMSDSGAHIVRVRYDGGIDIWSTTTGKRIGPIEIAPGERRRTEVVMLGNPCVALIAVGARFDKYWRTSAARPIEIWACDSENRVAQLPRGGGAAGSNLLDLVALSSCGLAVAAYSDRVEVVDVKRAVLLDDLRSVFEPARRAALDSYPEPERKARGGTVSLSLAASSSDDRCIVYGVVQHWDRAANAPRPAALYAFDLAARRARLLHGVQSTTLKGAGLGVGELVVSPAGQRATVVVRYPDDRSRAIPMGGGTVADLVVIDLQGQTRSRVLNTPRLTVSIAEAAFLTEDVLALTTLWIGNTEAMLVDVIGDRLHSACSLAFGEPNPARGNPRSIAVNARLSRVAISMREEIRVYRYRPNRNGRWAGIVDCVDD